MRQGEGHVAVLRSSENEKVTEKNMDIHKKRNYLGMR